MSPVAMTVSDSITLWRSERGAKRGTRGRWRGELDSLLRIGLRGLLRQCGNTYGEAAARLRCSYHTIWRGVARGKIKACKYQSGRIPAVEVERLVRGE